MHHTAPTPVTQSPSHTTAAPGEPGVYHEDTDQRGLEYLFGTTTQDEGTETFHWPPTPTPSANTCRPPPAERTSTDQARATLTALAGYYQREAQPPWREHSRRTQAPLSELETDTDTDCAVPHRVQAGEWIEPTARQKKARREVRMDLDSAHPHPFTTGQSVHLLTHHLHPENTPLRGHDILIVAPYNLQVRTLHQAAHHTPQLAHIRVGTVDRFQGQQAGRGTSFALNRNRLNAALSRAQRIAALTYAPDLRTTTPHTVDELRLVAAFNGLTDTAHPWPTT